MFLKIKSFDAVEEAQGIFEAYANVKWLKDKAQDVTIDGAFSKSIDECKAKGRMPKMLLQHDYKQVIGVWVDMEEDDKGLKVKGQLCLDTQLGKDTYALLKMGALDALSIGYVVKKETYDPKTNTNFLEEIDLREISVVTFPCNEESLVDSVKQEPIKEEELPNTNNNNNKGDNTMEFATKSEIAELQTNLADLNEMIAGLSAANDEPAPVKNTAEELKAKFYDVVKTGEGVNGMELVKEGAVKSFNVTEDASAGAGVVTSVSNQIVTSLLEDYRIPAMFGRETAGSTKYEKRVQVGHSGARWEGENVAGANGANTGTPEFATVAMTHGKVIATPLVTQEALKDPFFNAEALIMTDVRKQMGRLVAEGLLNGSGVNAPKGFYKHFGETADHETFKLVSLPYGTDEELITALQALQFELKTGYLAGAKYVMSRTMFQRVAGIKDGLGRPMMQVSLDKDVAGSIFGFPIVVDAHASEEVPVVLGRLDEAFKVVEIPTALEMLRNPYKIDFCVQFTVAHRIGTIVGDAEAVVGLKAAAGRKAK
ncbi:TPA: phage major capsid protein [Vibrio parahaemolyticus]